MSTKTDIVVLGGGIAGLAAAVKAGRLGADVILVEHYPFIGGMATAGMVSPFMRYATDGEVLVKGIFQDLQEGMQDKRGMVENGFRTDAFRYAARDLLKDAGVKVWTNANILSASVSNGLMTSITVIHGGLEKEIQARIFIDTSGDAQLVHLGGFPTESGKENSGL